MVAEARLAEEVSLAESGLSEQIEQTLQAFELPIRIPNGLDPEALRRGLKVDKKRRSGVARLALAVCIGKVQYGFEMAEEELWSRCLSSMDRT
jgi:3-dehydroquinate synthase